MTQHKILPDRQRKTLRSYKRIALAMAPTSLYLLHGGFDINEDYDNKSKLPRRLIHLVCKTQEGKTRVLKVMDWLPYVYIKGICSSADKDEVHEHLWQSGIDSIQIVKRVQAVGFTNNKQVSYAKVRVRNWPVWCRDEAFKKRLYEKGVKPHSKFFCESGLRCGAWFAVRTGYNDVSLTDLTPQLEDSTPPTLTVMGYDLVSLNLLHSSS